MLSFFKQDQNEPYFMAEYFDHVVIQGNSNLAMATGQALS